MILLHAWLFPLPTLTSLYPSPLPLSLSPSLPNTYMALSSSPLLRQLQGVKPLRAPSIWTPELSAEADENLRAIASLATRLEGGCTGKEERIARLQEHLREREAEVKGLLRDLGAMDNVEEGMRERVGKALVGTEGVRGQLGEMEVEGREALMMLEMAGQGFMRKEEEIVGGKAMVGVFESRLQKTRERQIRRDRQVSAMAILVVMAILSLMLWMWLGSSGREQQRDGL
jgi:hypothetical protein